MNQSYIAERIESFSRVLLAHGVTALLFLLNAASLAFPYSGEVRPHFLLMAVYYWAIYRPTLIPPAAAFFLGLAMDIASGFPLGLNAIVFLGVQWIVRRQRLFLTGQPYLVVWFGFALACAIATLALWLLIAVFAGGFPPPVPVIAGAALSVFLFPPVTLLLFLVHRIMPVASKSLR